MMFSGARKKRTAARVPGKTSARRAEPTAEADRGRHLSIPRFDAVAGDPGSLVVAFRDGSGLRQGDHEAIAVDPLVHHRPGVVGIHFTEMVEFGPTGR